MKNIHILPTNTPSRLFLWMFEVLRLLKTASTHPTGNVHIYITSNEKIKIGEWGLSKLNEIIKFCAGYDPTHYAKIILTTDYALVKKGVQHINNEEFLEWFVKYPTSEYIEISIIEQRSHLTLNDWVDADDKGNFPVSIAGAFRYRRRYKIILPKENSCEKTVSNIEEDKTPHIDRQEIVGYRLKPSIDRLMVDGVLKNAMPIWNKEDKAVYFIRGHIAGSLVARMKALQVLDLWFTPIYENEEVKSDWVKQEHLAHYHEVGIMKRKNTYSEEEVIAITEWYLDNFLNDALGLNGKEAEKRVEHIKGKGLTKEVLNYWHEHFNTNNHGNID